MNQAPFLVRLIHLYQSVSYLEPDLGADGHAYRGTHRGMRPVSPVQAHALASLGLWCRGCRNPRPRLHSSPPPPRPPRRRRWVTVRPAKWHQLLTCLHAPSLQYPTPSPTEEPTASPTAEPTSVSGLTCSGPAGLSPVILPMAEPHGAPDGGAHRRPHRGAHGGRCHPYCLTNRPVTHFRCWSWPCCSTPRARPPRSPRPRPRRRPRTSPRRCAPFPCRPHSAFASRFSVLAGADVRAHGYPHGCAHSLANVGHPTFGRSHCCPYRGQMPYRSRWVYQWTDTV
jgi:hypothetical protein